MVIRKLARRTTEDELLRPGCKRGAGRSWHARRNWSQELPLPLAVWARLLAESLLERAAAVGGGADLCAAQLVPSALALPTAAYRMTGPQELPVGGYTDIVTRGQVEQLLPTQFALDELEFLRRFSENELLYFRREEPPAQNRQELVVLLDQGVRTWGDVRLVLAAAAARPAASKRSGARRRSGWRRPAITATSSIRCSKTLRKSLGQLLEAQAICR